MNFSGMSSEELMEAFVKSGLMVNRKLVEEIIRREDSPEHLLNILKGEGYWLAGGKGDGWPPIHALFVLGLIGSKNAMEALKYALRNRVEELGDWVTEHGSQMLFAFGKGFFEDIREIAFDETLDMFVRLEAIDAICALSIINSELTPMVAEACRKFLEGENDEMICLALPHMAEVKDEGLFEAVKSCWATKTFANDVAGMEDLEELHSGSSDMPLYPRVIKSLWEHFSEKELGRLHKVALDNRTTKTFDTRITTIGAGDLCYCGSGKKYKKCFHR